MTPNPLASGHDAGHTPGLVAASSLLPPGRAPRRVETDALHACRLAQGVTAAAFGLPGASLDAPGRGEAGRVLARQIAMYVAHVGGRAPMPEIARHYGRDRTTVSHALGVVEDRRDDPGFDRLVGVLESAVRLGLALGRGGEG